MFGQILDSIPGVGHAKGLWHYAYGNFKAGDRAIYEATRSTAVMVGGAVGMLSGPVGMVALATSAGGLTDIITSAITREPTGVILGVTEIAMDISNGELPLGSISRTGLIVGSDIVGGLGGATITHCATRIINKSAGKAVGKVVIEQFIKSEMTLAAQSTFAHGASRVVIEDSEKNSEYRNQGSRPSPPKPSSSKSGGSTDQSFSTGYHTNASKKSERSQSSSTGGSGGQPPNNNQNNKREHSEKKASHWEAFLEIFKKQTLEDIIIKRKRIFKDLNDYQKKVLKDLIIEIRNSGYLDLGRIVNITVKLLSQLEEDDVTFRNFQFLTKFVIAYVHELVIQRNDAFNHTPSNFPNISETYDTRRNQLAGIIISEITNSISGVFNLLKVLANEIKDLIQTTKPQFVNLFAAVYHYFKHKFLPEKNITFNPVQYFGLAKEMLIRLEKLPRFQQLLRDGKKRIIYEKYYPHFGRRLMVVLKFQATEWKLSSCYFINNVYENDADGDEWINGEKLSHR